MADASEATAEDPRVRLDRVARLARLELSDAERERYAGDLDRILGWCEALSRFDLDGVEPTSHPVDVTRPLREDAAGAELPRDVALAGAPKTDGEAFLVPLVVSTSGVGG